MSNKNEKPFYKKPEWYLEKCTPTILAIVFLIVNYAINKKSIITLIVSIIIYVSLVLVFLIISSSITRHYNKKHGNPEACQKAIDENCKKVESLYSDCESVIEKINSKLLEQEKHVSEVNKLIGNAEKLEDMYANAVAKHLRTNEQVIALENKVKKNSEIYIMTSGFLLERYNDTMRKSIADNIVKGIKYKYIIPEKSDNDFKQMVYAIMAEVQNSFPSIDETTLEDYCGFIRAVQIPEEFCMLTVAYYELGNSKDLSAVIVKLPADNINDVNETEALTYMVPSGQRINNRNKAYFIEHKRFLDCMSEIYKNEKSQEIVFKKSDLSNAYPKGVEISNSQIIKLK